MPHAQTDRANESWWQDMFARPRALEQALDARVAQIIDEFLDAPRIDSGIDFDHLARGFSDSWLREPGTDPEAYLDTVAERVIAHASHTSSPTFIGHMTSALPYFLRPLSRLLVALNQNVVKVETAKSFTPYEREALALLHRLVYDRDDHFYQAHVQARNSTLGAITSGGTTANLMGLWIARNTVLGPRGDFPGVEQAGLAAALRHYGDRRLVTIGSSLMHYSLDKSAAMLGLGTDGLIRIAVDGRGRMDPDAVRRELAACQKRGDRVMAIVGVAGTTDAGSIDPLNDLADIAEAAGIHFHVDAAWGGPVLFSHSHRDALAGIARADSVTIDGHKQLYLPMGIGMLLVRDPAAARMIEKQAQYIIRSDSDDLGRRTIEGSRPGMALYLHAALRIFGRGGYRYLIDEGVRKARYLAAAVRRSREFELLVEPALNIVNYRYLPRPERAGLGDFSDSDNERINRANQVLQERQTRAGRTFVSRTTLQFTRYATPVVALRAVLANPLTREHHIDAVLRDQLAIGAELFD